MGLPRGAHRRELQSVFHCNSRHNVNDWGLLRAVPKTNTDECAGQKCSGHGKCQDGIAKYSCSCDPGWGGKDCQIAKDCSGGPGGKPCQNQGWPTGKTERCKCLCMAGFEGAYCEVNIDDCKLPNQLCSGTGKCIDQINGYRCECKPGYIGDNCERKTTTTKTTTTTTTVTTTTTTTTVTSTTTTTTTTTTLQRCKPGQVLVLPANVCEPCPDGTYLPKPEHSETECLTHSPCSDTEVVLEVGTATKPYRCKSSTECTADQYESSPLDGGSDRECTELRVCRSYEYESAAPTGTTDRVCDRVSDCDYGQHVVSPPTATKDRECAECDPAEHLWSRTRNPGECDVHQFCGKDQRVTKEGSSTRDLRCGSCPRGQFQDEEQHRSLECKTTSPTTSPTHEPTAPPSPAPTKPPTTELTEVRKIMAHSICRGIETW